MMMSVLQSAMFNSQPMMTWVFTTKMVNFKSLIFFKMLAQEILTSNLVLLTRAAAQSELEIVNSCCSILAHSMSSSLVYLARTQFLSKLVMEVSFSVLMDFTRNMATLVKSLQMEMEVNKSC